MYNYHDYIDTKESLEMFLLSHNIKLIGLFLTSPGEVTILTDRSVPDIIEGQLAYLTTTGTVFTLKTLESHVCICFGPPVKDCPVHFAP
jgi:hypothetical protein